MTVVTIQALTLTAYGQPAIAVFPEPLENPSGFPQIHSLEDGFPTLDFF
jgi:hypothetical protein